jgi:hypothetical protein
MKELEHDPINDVRFEREPDGTQTFVIEPPNLTAETPRWNTRRDLDFPYGTLEIIGHMQTKEISNDPETGITTYKNGSGDHVGFTVIRKPGVFTLALVTAQDGLTAAWEEGWKNRLDSWNIHTLQIPGEIPIPLDNPDVAFSRLLRLYPKSHQFARWRRDTVEGLNEAISVDLSLLTRTSLENIRIGDTAKQDALFARTILATRSIMDRLFLSTADFRNHSLWPNRPFEKNLHYSPELFDWYINGPFATAGILIIEPLLLQPERRIDDQVVELSHYGGTLMIEHRSRADTLAFSGPLDYIMVDGRGVDFMGGQTWLGDPNIYTDRLIETLRQQGMSPEQIEKILLEKPQNHYATYPSKPENRGNTLRATTYQNIQGVHITRAQIAFTLTDGMTYPSRNPLERNTTNTDTISAIAKTLNKIHSPDFQHIMDANGYTTDDRSLGVITYKPRLLARKAEIEQPDTYHMR